MSASRHRDPLLLSLETPLHAVFYPLGFRLEIETNDRRVLESVESSFHIFSRNGPPPAEAPAGASLHMRLVCVPAEASGPPWPAAAYRAWGDLFAVVCGPENFLVADLARRRVMGFFSPAMLEDREFFRWTFPDCATYVLLVRHWLTPVHAACVVRDGQGICLCGPAGAGKTSLAYACARAGYGLLTEDVVYLHRFENPMSFRGNPTRLHFRVSARELFPELHQVPITMRRERHEYLAVRVEQWLPGRVVTQADPGALVFLDRGPTAAASLEPVPASEAQWLLYEDLRRDEERMMEAHQQMLQRLVQTGAYRLHYLTLDQALEQLDRLPLSKGTVE